MTQCAFHFASTSGMAFVNYQDETMLSPLTLSRSLLLLAASANATLAAPSDAKRQQNAEAWRINTLAGPRKLGAAVVFNLQVPARAARCYLFAPPPLSLAGQPLTLTSSTQIKGLFSALGAAVGAFIACGARMMTTAAVFLVLGIPYAGLRLALCCWLPPVAQPALGEAASVDKCVEEAMARRLASTLPHAQCYEPFTFRRPDADEKLQHHAKKLRADVQKGLQVFSLDNLYAEHTLSLVAENSVLTEASLTHLRHITDDVSTWTAQVAGIVNFGIFEAFLRCSPNMDLVRRVGPSIFPAEALLPPGFGLTPVLAAQSGPVTSPTNTMLLQRATLRRLPADRHQNKTVKVIFEAAWRLKCAPADSFGEKSLPVRADGLKSALDAASMQFSAQVTVGRPTRRKPVDIRVSNVTYNVAGAV